MQWPQWKLARSSGGNTIWLPLATRLDIRVTAGTDQHWFNESMPRRPYLRSTARHWTGAAAASIFDQILSKPLALVHQGALTPTTRGRNGDRMQM